MTVPKRRSRQTAISSAVLHSRLLARGGFDVYEGLLEDRFQQQLFTEAQMQYAEAVACDVAVSDGEEVRGGVPERRFLSSSGGVVQDSFYRAPWVLAFLRELTAAELVPSGERGTYSYYVRPGDFLGLHRDIVTCDVAVITCLSNGTIDNASDGGHLCLYPERIDEPLSAIRATPEKGALKLLLKPGQTIVMYGGIVPHALLPVTPGQERIVSVLCYKIPNGY